MLKKKTEKNDEKVKKNLKNVKFQKCENTGAENGNFGDGLMPAIFKTGARQLNLFFLQNIILRAWIGYGVPSISPALYVTTLRVRNSIIDIAHKILVPALKFDQLALINNIPRVDNFMPPAHRSENFL